MWNLNCGEGQEEWTKKKTLLFGFRMMVTDDEKELLQMYEMAEIRLQRIHKIRVKEFDRKAE